jgi:hypothetical protein
MQAPRGRKGAQFADRSSGCDRIARMPRPALAFLALSALALTLAGCGGTKNYQLAATRKCFAHEEGAQLRPVPKSDFIARNALGGALSVAMRGNEVTITFGRDSKVADGVATAYRRVHGANIGIEDVLRPQRNVVLLWRAHPSDHDLSLVNSCLK